MLLNSNGPSISVLSLNAIYLHRILLYILCSTFSNHVKRIYFSIALFFHLSFFFSSLLLLVAIFLTCLSIINDNITPQIDSLKQCHKMDGWSIMKKPSKFNGSSIIRFLSCVYLPGLYSVGWIVNRVIPKDVCTVNRANGQEAFLLLILTILRMSEENSWSFDLPLLDPENYNKKFIPNGCYHPFV